MVPILHFNLVKKIIMIIDYSFIYQIYRSISEIPHLSPTVPHKHSITKPQINILFPWRHSSQPLLRLSRNFEGGNIGPCVPNFSPLLRKWMYFNAIGFMGIPLWEIIFGRKWKQELCEGFCVAYERGLCSLLSEVYNIPLEVMTNINDKTTVDNRNPATLLNFSVNFQTGLSRQNPKPYERLYKNVKNTKPKLNDMIDVKLQQLYQYTRDSRDLSIQLYSKPVYSEIVSAFLVPFLTRQEVEDYPELQRSFRNIIKSIADEEVKRGSPLSFWETTRLVMRDISTLGKNQIIRKNDLVQCTLIVQAMIHCHEIFHVKDIQNGSIIQGKDDGLVKEVCHLVRFERVGSFFCRR